MGLTFKSIKQKARNLVSAAPGYLQKARSFATGVIAGVGKAQKVISGVNQAVQDTPQIFNERIRDGAHKATGHVTKGAALLADKHKHAEGFLERVNKNLNLGLD